VRGGGTYPSTATRVSGFTLIVPTYPRCTVSNHFTTSLVTLVKFNHITMLHSAGSTQLYNCSGAPVLLVEGIGGTGSEQEGKTPTSISARCTWILTLWLHIDSGRESSLSCGLGHDPCCCYFYRFLLTNVRVRRRPHVWC
jgi:hypothetical protein